MIALKIFLEWEGGGNKKKSLVPKMYYYYIHNILKTLSLIKSFCDINWTILLCKCPPLFPIFENLKLLIYFW